MLKDAIGTTKNIKIDTFENLYLVKYAKKIGAQYILRGLRNSSDCTYEQGICNINRDIDSSITTVVLMPPRDLCEISSSMIKGLIGVDGWKEIIKQYVPLSVLEKL
jgi:pantetheine-phosphate adenylyltransferase